MNAGLYLMGVLRDMKTLILLSGGIDSTVLLADTQRLNEAVTLTLDYGQLHKKEIVCARWQAEHYKVQWIYKDIKEIFYGFRHPLLGTGGEIPQESYADQLKSHPNFVNTYVPFRNGIMLSIAAAIALREECGCVAYAAHMDDAAGSAYPDCSPEFVETMKGAIETGTSNKVTLSAPWVEERLVKKDIVAKGLQLAVHFEQTWSCYFGGIYPCGKCGTCIDRKNAFLANGAEPQ